MVLVCLVSLEIHPKKVYNTIKRLRGEAIQPSFSFVTFERPPFLLRWQGVETKSQSRRLRGSKTSTKACPFPNTPKQLGEV